MAKKAQNTPVEKSIEDRIWESANKLRGSLDASEYRNVVLGLIFLKYISDCFDHRYQELVEEGEGFEEDRDEYTADHIFWVPAAARWAVIADDAHNASNGKTIDTAMEAIEKENPRLKNILPKNTPVRRLIKSDWVRLLMCSTTSRCTLTVMRWIFSDVSTNIA